MCPASIAKNVRLLVKERIISTAMHTCMHIEVTEKSFYIPLTPMGTFQHQKDNLKRGPIIMWLHFHIASARLPKCLLWYTRQQCLTFLKSLSALS